LIAINNNEPIKIVDIDSEFENKMRNISMDMSLQNKEV
jgi:hypothetical protein